MFKNASALVQDTLQNFVSALQTSRDKSSFGRYAFKRLDWAELESAYRGDWIARKVIDIPAFDMTRKWRSWDADKDDVKKIEAAEKAFQIRAKVRKALCWSRLYGGAALYLDDGGDAREPLSPQTLRQGQLQTVHVLSRRKLNVSLGFNNDLTSNRFGEPENYQVTSRGVNTAIVHSSRIIPVRGAPAPDTDDYQDFWGDPILQILYDAVQNATKVPNIVSSLMEEAKVDIVEVKDLANKIVTTDQRAKTVERWSLFNLNKSINNSGLLDADSEKLVTRQINFTHHAELIEKFLLIASGAADIPLTRFVGQSPAGLNATGESDLANYYDSISGKQEADLGPVLDELDAYMQANIFGQPLDDATYSFKSLWTLSDKDQAEIMERKAKAISLYVAGQVVNREALKAGVEGMISEDGTLPGFAAKLEEIGDDDDDILLPGIEPEEPPEVTDARPRTLYVRRQVKNASEIIAWARSQGISSTIPENDLHVTIANSLTPIDWMSVNQSWQEEIEIKGGARLLERFGPDKQTLVLLFKSDQLDYRHEEFKARGATWSWSDYQPHITITYDAGDIDMDGIEPYQGDIILGPEIFEEVKTDWQKSIKEATT